MRPRIRVRHAIALLALVSATFSCSDAKKKPSSDDDDAREEPRTHASASSSGAAASPTDAASVMAAVRPDMMHAGYLDLKALRDRGWFKILDSLPPDVSEPVRELVKKCGTEPWGVLDQAAWSGAKDEAFVLVAKLGVSPDATMTCIKNVSGRATDVTIGADKGLKVGGVSAVIHQGLLVVGIGKPFDDVLADVPAEKSALRDKVTAGPDQALRVAFDATKVPGAPVDEVLGTLTTSATQFSLAFEVKAPNEKAAEGFETQAKGALEQLGSMGKDAPPIPPIRITRDGAVLHVVLEKAGGAEEQVALLGTLSAVSIYGVRRYLANSKAAEAKNTVASIARGMVAAIEREEIDPTGKVLPHLCPASAPPVPADVPAGKKYMSSESDWSGSWKDLRFMLSSPQYYRYRTETSPDRKKCTAIAEGDLDGNGTLSKFSLTVEIDASGNPRIAPQLSIENEFE